MSDNHSSSRSLNSSNASLTNAEASNEFRSSVFMRESSQKVSSMWVISSRSSTIKSKAAKKILEELNRLPLDRLGDQLYGREKEMEALHLAYSGLQPNNGSSGSDLPMNLLTVAGLSGTGKSTLVKEFQRQIRLKDKTVLFASGKFDQQLRSLPYHSFVTALTQLVSEFDALPTSDIQQLQETLGEKYHVLLDLIPNLGELFQTTTPTTSKENRSIDEEESESEESYDVVRSQARFKFVFSKFLSCMCQPKNKVVLFLDDLQWIDPACTGSTFRT